MFDQLLAARDGFGIAVDAQHAAIGGFQDGAAVAAAAKGPVDIAAAVAGLKRRENFVQHNGQMTAHAPPPCAARRARSSRAFIRARASAWMGA